MKKIISFTLTLVLLAVTVAGCTSGQVASKKDIEQQAAHTLTIYTSFYPMYFLTSEIVKDKAEVINLTPAGVEPHDWEPTPKTVAKLQSADMLIYNGAGMEGWVSKVMDSLSNKAIVAVDTSKSIELIKPVEHEHEHEGEEAGEEEEEHEHGEYDPHLWVSPYRLLQQGQNILAALIELDPSNKADYEANFDKLAERLQKLDADYREAVKAFQSKVIITSHDSFGYLAHDYGLEQISIRGITPDDEPSPAKMADLVEECRQHQVKYIFFEKLVSPKLSETLAKEVGAGTLILNAVHGLDEEDMKQGKDYISIMYENLENLKKALGE